VLGFVWLAVMTGITRLPSALSWPGLAGVGLLAGIGFTMSLFIANLAYGAGGELDQAKIGVLAASTVAAVLGLTFLHYALPSGSEAGRVRTEGAPAD
jgi:NhaA family Na+:H+ antiporter